MWLFPNDLPIAGEPADVYATLKEADHALTESSYPKLLFAGKSGRLDLAGFRPIVYWLRQAFGMRIRRNPAERPGFFTFA
jgi:hypothetical protein